MFKILCIFNPEAGRGRFKVTSKDIMSRFRKAAEASGKKIDIKLLETEMSGDAEDLAREHREDDLDVVVACGGDGTIYEVVNGIVGSGKAVGIIPLGSGNDTILSISGRKKGIDECIDDILEGERYPIDVGRLNDRYFLNVVGVGMDAAINHEVADRRDMVKKFGPTIQYMFCTFKTIPKWKDMDMIISEDGKKEYSKNVKMLTIGNGTVCGGGFRLTPKALMNDGKLDISLIKGAGTLKTMINVPKAYKGNHLKVKELTEYRKVKKLEVRTKDDRELPFHIDGEKGFSRKFSFKIYTGKLWTMHPKAS